MTSLTAEERSQKTSSTIMTVPSPCRQVSMEPEVSIATGTVEGTKDNAKEGKQDKELLEAKQFVSKFHKDLEDACHIVHNDEDEDNNETVDIINQVLKEYTANDGNTDGLTSYVFRSVYPFREVDGGTWGISTKFWTPFAKSFGHLQRRPDIFIGSKNMLHHNEPDTDHSSSEQEGYWVLSMGHFMGLFDEDWLGIRSSHQMSCVRYAEFNHVVFENATPRIVQTGLFLDLVGLMCSVGMNPLMTSTGATLSHYPGPRTHDGLIWTNQNAPLEQAIETQALVDRMIDDLSSINHLNTCSPDLLRRTWHEDMIWYGPAGIGTTYTIRRYQEQHQLPFRSQLSDKKFCGHVCRMAEGNYAAFFGWPQNLTNKNLGGFLGLPQSSSADCPMQVVDVYRRDNNKLSENWIFIDLLWYMKHQGVDALERTTRILNPSPRTMKQSAHSRKKRKTDEELNVAKKVSAAAAAAAKAIPVSSSSSSSDNETENNDDKQSCASCAVKDETMIAATVALSNTAVMNAALLSEL